MHTVKRIAPVAALAVLAIAAWFWVLPGSDAAAATADPASLLESVGALTFGADGTLYVGDSKGARIVALDLSGAEAGAGDEPIGRVEDLDGKIAAATGASVRDIFIKDLAVHPKTGEAYLSVMRGQGPDAAPLLVRVSKSGEIAELAPGSVEHRSLALADAPQADADARRDPRTLTITDLQIAGGELLIAGLSNEEFASTLRRAKIPFDGETRASGLEIYHGAHGKFETHAPIYAFMPTEIGGEPQLLAGYLCTPLVTFPLDEIGTEKKLRGKTIAELGWGNVPFDIVSYEHEGESYVLIGNSRRGTMKLKATDIAAAMKRPGITSEAGPETGVPYEGSPLGSVVQIADLDAERMLFLVRELENGSLTLSPRPKSFI